MRHKTGAYRLTARYHMQGDPATTFHWYGDFPDGGGVYNFRDAAIVVSPTKARSMVMYELNVLNVDAEAPASETDSSQRSTFVDLYGGPGATTAAPLQPDLREEISASTGSGCSPSIPSASPGGRPIRTMAIRHFAVGSPYAVKNFFAVNPSDVQGLRRDRMTLPGARLL